MSGKDDGPRRDLDDWIETSRAEMDSLRRKVDEELTRHFPGVWDDGASPNNRSPSERFKNFIDSSLGTLSQGLRNFPSNITELKSRMQSEWAARQEEERDIWRRWTGTDLSPDHIQMQIERSTDHDLMLHETATGWLLNEADRRNSHVSLDKIVALYRDGERAFGGLDQFATPMLSFGGACYYKPETVDNLPSTARWGWLAPKQTWLGVEWFKRDSYSPIRLEAHPDLQASGAKWRAAFEDLLCAALDKPMVSEEKFGQRMPYGKKQSTFYGPGLDWMLSLQCRGILPPQLPAMYRVNAKHSPQSLLCDLPFPKLSAGARRAHEAGDRDYETDFAIMQDFNRLVDAVAIQPDGPLVLDGVFEAPQPLRDEPETELDYYEGMAPAASDPYVDLAQGDRMDELQRERRVMQELRTRREHETQRAQQFDGRCPVGSQRSTSHASGEQCSRFYDEDETLPESRYDETRLHYEPPRPTDSARPTDVDQTPSHSAVRANEGVTGQKPDVLSQLTMTETKRLPDGTVTTRVMLKQRFADGTEQSREDVHTSYEQAPTTTEPPLEQKKDETEPSKGGWFWS